MIKFIVQDTREQIGKHRNIEKFMESKGIHIIRDKVYAGDYTLPTDRTVSVDIKQNVLEIASNICSSQHARFRRECERAREIGCKLYVLIQERDTAYGEITHPSELWKWESPVRKSGRFKGMPYTRLKGETIGKAMITMEKNYGVEFLFCRPQEAGQIVLDLLSKEKI